MPTDLLDSYLVFPVFRAEASEQSCFVALPWGLFNASVQGLQCQYQADAGKAHQALSKMWVCSPQRPSATPSMDLDRWNPSFCVLLHCSEVRAVDACQFSISNTATPVNSLYLSISSPPPRRVAEQQPFPWRGWALVLPCSVWGAPLLCWWQWPWHCLFHGISPGHRHPVCFQLVSPCLPSPLRPVQPLVQKQLPWTEAKFLTKKHQFKWMFIRV